MWEDAPVVLTPGAGPKPCTRERGLHVPDKPPCGACPGAGAAKSGIYLCTFLNSPLFVVRRASALPKLCKMNTTISSTTTQTLTIS